MRYTRYVIALVALFMGLLSACTPQMPTDKAPTEPPAEDTEAPTETPPETTPTEDDTTDESTVAVSVDEQVVEEDNIVTIANVTALEPGWLVIHADRDGSPGPVIGFAAVEAGENMDIAVEIDPQGATETLYAMLHTDNGTKGEYEFPDADPPVQDAEGNVVVTPFMVEIAEDEADEDQAAVDTIALELLAEGFAAPIDLEAAGDGRLIVADQTGLLYVITVDGMTMDEPFLDIRERLVELAEDYDERGLLGLALHPNFAENNRFYVYYSAPNPETDVSLVDPFTYVNRLSEWQVTEMGNVDPDSERVLLEIPQPQTNHNGGDISFGADGFLYVPLGDGGGADDIGPGHVEDWYEDNEGGNGQDLDQNFLGSILRIDVSNGDPYAIPVDNPILGDASEPSEQWAFGFRNPWRATWDRETGEYFVADAGQDLWEEVSIVDNGGNYGWNVMEASHCFNSDNPETEREECPSEDAWGNILQMPVIEFPNGSGDDGVRGLVVVGGYAYRGSALPALEGSYVFGQWSRAFDQPDGSLIVADRADNGELWSLRELSIEGRDEGKLGEFVLAFGQDADGELYVLTDETPDPFGETGKVYKIVPADSAESTAEDTGDEDTTDQEGAASEEGETVTVSAVNFEFDPLEITVSLGTTVVWQNDSSATHTVTADDGSFASGDLAAGAAFEFTFEEPGEYPYYCEFHSGAGGRGMSGTVVVTDS